MFVFKAILKAVDSRYATDDELAAADLKPGQYPPSYHIMAHQAATIQALRSGDAPIIINTAMTGDGKTLAGRLQLFNDRSWRTLAMYPTNELANDQQRSLDELLNSNWRMPNDIGNNYRVISASLIDQYINELEDTLTWAEGIQQLLKNDYVMTNPDIFHLMMSFAYRQYGAARDSTLGVVANRYRLFVFDEFHLFGVAQISAVMLALLLLQRVKGEVQPPRFLFLSATPQDMLKAMAERVGLATKTIGGEYQHGSSVTSSGWRRILQQATLHLHTERLEDWVIAHVDDIILPFFAQYRPGAKGLIIANGVATAHRVHAYLYPICEKIGIRVGINTGLTPKSQRDYDVDLLIATSTVDVGVDFKINLLIFESLDAASHTQRLGRLGRHTKSSAGHPFNHFEAHALVPGWVAERIAAAYPDGASIDRETYKKEVSEHFQPLQVFEKYVQKWAGLQAAYILYQLNKFEIKTQYEHITEPLKQDYIKLFGSSSLKKYNALSKTKQQATLNAAYSFRGGSVFTALQTEGRSPTSEVGSYNLIPLLMRAELQAVEIETLYQQADANHRRDKNSLQPSSQSLKRTEPLAAYRVLGWLDKPRIIEVLLPDDLAEQDYTSVIECAGFQLSVVGIPELQRLNDELLTRTLVALIIPYKTPDILKRILRLGYQLEILPCKQRSMTGSVVFGRDALLMDAVLLRYRESNQPIIL